MSAFRLQGVICTSVSNWRTSAIYVSGLLDVERSYERLTNAGWIAAFVVLCAVSGYEVMKTMGTIEKFVMGGVLALFAIISLFVASFSQMSEL